MNEELQNKLVEILTGIQEGVRASSTFVLEQLPDVAQQYLLYGRLVESVYILVFCVFLPFLALKAWKIGHTIEEEEPREFVCGLSVLAGTFSFVIGFSSGIKEFILVFFAPKVWLLTELAKLIK